MKNEMLRDFTKKPVQARFQTLLEFPVHMRHQNIRKLRLIQLEKIAEVTGRENIIVRIFDRKKFKGKDHTIFSDFLEAIGVDYTDDFKITEEEANRSLTGNSQEILHPA